MGPVAIKDESERGRPDGEGSRIPGKQNPDGRGFKRQRQRTVDSADLQQRTRVVSPQPRLIDGIIKGDQLNRRREMFVFCSLSSFD